MAAITETQVTLTSQPDYPDDPQLVVNFTPEWLLFTNTASAVVAHYSFDGVNDHGYINPAVSPQSQWPGEGKPQHVKVWLRRDSAGIDACVVVITGGTSL